MMSHEEGEELYGLTFAQREGKAPLPEPIKLEQLPQEFKQLIWLTMHGMSIGMAGVTQAQTRIG